MSTASMPSVEQQMATLRRGTVEIISEQELRAKIEASAKTGRPLRVKLGIDPTAPDIHLGHTVVLRKLRQFQDLGHLAVLIIGDYTTLVGDPSGRSKTRPMLSIEEVNANAQTYVEQVGKVIDLKRAEVRRNGEWFAAMSFTDVLRLASKMTVARMLERDDFSKRYKAGEPIAVHELLYPLMQGYDSVMVQADVELGATEQTFNLLVGRELQRDAGQEAQVCLTLPVLPGTDGVQRMSKSIGNYIGVDESPQQMYGKVMSIPDHIMRDMFVLATDVPEGEINRLLAPGAHPRDAKAALARRIVEMYHSSQAAQAAEAEFNRIFAEHELPSDMPQVELPAGKLKGGSIWIVDLLREAGLVSSGSEARRLVAQGGVEIDGQRIDDEQAQIALSKPVVIKAGKRRFARVKPGV
jgi:tyrosyl-tRNA synthetase